MGGGLQFPRIVGFQEKRNIHKLKLRVVYQRWFLMLFSLHFLHLITERISRQRPVMVLWGRFSF